jgi:hypothetical protein
LADGWRQASGIFSRGSAYLALYHFSISGSPRLRIPLFAPAASLEDPLRLIEAKPFPSGIVQLTYERAPNA